MAGVFLTPTFGAGWQGFTNTGLINAGGRLYTYVAGSTTPTVTYTDATGLVPNANPIILDSTGRIPTSAEMWQSSGSVIKVIVTDANGVTLQTNDNLTGVGDLSQVSGPVTVNNGLIVNGGIQFTDSIGTSNITPYALRNRIINGDFVVSQYNSSSSVTPTANGQYVIDRWNIALSVASKLSVQQNAGGIAPPVGYNSYAGITSLSNYAVAAGDFFCLVQPIEGFNVRDLGFGLASALPVVLSFWVRSSLTGTFGGSITNSGSTRSYPFIYSIASANTWTFISVPIPGDITGTWLTSNALGLRVAFGLGVGTTFSGASGVWAGANYLSSTGAVSVVGTNGATFYITGAQLEKGIYATPFEWRNYSDTLAECQRYYLSTTFGGTGFASSATNIRAAVSFPVTMRAAATSVANPAIATFSVGGASFSQSAAGSVSGVNLSADAALVSFGSFAGLTGGTAAISAPGANIVLTLQAEL